jgi:hypothetical protein
MTVPGRWLSVLWPLVLLAVFAVTFRRAAPTEAGTGGAADCGNLAATGRSTPRRPTSIVSSAA